MILTLTCWWFQSTERDFLNVRVRYLKCLDNGRGCGANERLFLHMAIYVSMVKSQQVLV